MMYDDMLIARDDWNWVLFVVGKRTIRRNKELSYDKREEGAIDNAGYRGRVWRGGTPQEVVEAMDRDLGPIPEREYHVEE